MITFLCHKRHLTLLRTCRSTNQNTTAEYSHSSNCRWSFFLSLYKGLCGHILVNMHTYQPHGLLMVVNRIQFVNNQPKFFKMYMRMGTPDISKFTPHPSKRCTEENKQHGILLGKIVLSRYFPV